MVSLSTDLQNLHRLHPMGPIEICVHRESDPCEIPCVIVAGNQHEGIPVLPRSHTGGIDDINARWHHDIAVTDMHLGLQFGKRFSQCGSARSAGAISDISE